MSYKSTSGHTIQYTKKSAKGKHSSDRRLLIGPQTFKFVWKGGGGGGNLRTHLS